MQSKTANGPPNRGRIRARAAAPVARGSRAPSSAPSRGAAGGAAQIAPHRQNDALVAWQSARKRTAEESIEAAEDLFYLTNIFSNQYIEAKDWSRHPAMTESALEVFFLPRHRAALISTMC